MRGSAVASNAQSNSYNLTDLTKEIATTEFLWQLINPNRPGASSQFTPASASSDAILLIMQTPKAPARPPRNPLPPVINPLTNKSWSITSRNGVRYGSTAECNH